MQRLDVLTAKLGVTGAEVWRIYLSQSRVAVLECVTGILCGISMVFLARYLAGKATQEDEGAGWTIAAMLSLGVGLITLVLGLLSIWSPLLNPEFWALHQLLDDLSGAVGK